MRLVSASVPHIGTLIHNDLVPARVSYDTTLPPRAIGRTTSRDVTHPQITPGTQERLAHTFFEDEILKEDASC
jgi:hypothetical protein